MHVKDPCDYDEVYRIILTYEEQEINKVKWTCVFSGYNTYFVRPGHFKCMYINFGV